MTETDTLGHSRSAAGARYSVAGIEQPRVFARLGGIEARLARSRDEIAAAQKVRYRVFHEELGARPTPAQYRLRSDFDAWDDICDHLILVDRSAGDSAERQIVGTCRFLHQEIAEATGTGFCSQREFEFGGLLRHQSDWRFLELGRSCILKPSRRGRTLELLWAAIWNYARQCRADALLGCASFSGANCLKIAEPLSLLYNFAGAPSHWRISAHPHCAARMDWLRPHRIDRRRATLALPPLIKGYLRLGAMFGREAAIDRQFATVDVLVILPVQRINPRYVGYYGANGERHCASDLAQAAFEAGDSVSKA